MAEEIVVDVVKPLRWIDGGYCSVDGVPVDYEQRAYHSELLKTLQRTKVNSQKKLAVRLNVEHDNKRFVKALELLAQKGCIIRQPRKWDGVETLSFVPVEDPPITLTNKGEALAFWKPED
jgi:hypothetical protein